MSKIRFLDELVINQIAAGEVIENSASVVKELVENSLDSGAECVTVEILGGGRQLIRVSDDGCGMSLEEARLSLQRHATSKLVALEDLESINTKGFRGEAIPSIASISQMTLLTSNGDAPSGEKGSLLLIEGGKLLSESQAVRDRGTTMEIKSLFFNVPVRKKYQKSPSYDVRSVDKMLRQIALSHPYQGFQFISDGKTLFHVHPQEASIETGSAMRNRMENLMGRDLENFEWVDFEMDEIKIRGFIGNPPMAKRSRSAQIVWVNRRSIFSPLVAQSVKNGMGSMLQEGLYPAFSLFIDLPGTCVDVNVHPQKKEVRFCDEEKMRSLIAKAVYGTFHGKQSVFHFSPIDFSAPNENFSPFAFFNPGLPSTVQKEEQIEWIPSHFQSRPQIITLIKGYVVLEAQTLPKNWYEREREGLAFLDQRLAHERILLESLGSEGKESKVSQTLLIPKTIEVGALQCSLLKEHEDLLKKMGIDLKPFGETTIVVEALPESMEEVDLLALLMQLGDELQEYASSTQEKSALKLISRMAMRRDRRLSLVEANHLLDALMQCQHPSLCPRGRPVIKMVGLKELEKW